MKRTQISQFVALFVLTTVLGCSGQSSAVKPQGDIVVGKTEVPRLDPHELEATASQFVTYLDSRFRPVPPAGIYGRRFDRISRSYRNLGGNSYNFLTYGGSRIDAFSLPDGSVRLFSGLLDLLEDDEIAYELGKQLGFVTNGAAAARLEAALWQAGIDAKKRFSAEDFLLLEKAFFSLRMGEPYINHAEAYARAFLRNNRYSKEAADSAELKLAELSAYTPYAKTYGGADFLEVSENLEKEPTVVGASEAPVSEAAESSPEVALSETPPAEVKAEVAHEAKRLSESVEPAPTKPVSAAKEASPRVIKTVLSRSDLEREAARRSGGEKPNQASSKEIGNTFETDKSLSGGEVEEATQVVVLRPGWYLQAAALTEPEEARERAVILQAASVPTMIHEVTVRGTRYFRLLIGPYGSAEQADNLRDKVGELGVTEGEPFIRHVTIE